ncbi:hypothetical protein ACQP3F_29615, partial [Escherichia coli]
LHSDVLADKVMTHGQQPISPMFILGDFRPFAYNLIPEYAFHASLLEFRLECKYFIIRYLLMVTYSYGHVSLG